MIKPDFKFSIILIACALMVACTGNRSNNGSRSLEKLEVINENRGIGLITSKPID